MHAFTLTQIFPHMHACGACSKLIQNRGFEWVSISCAHVKFWCQPCMQPKILSNLLIPTNYSYCTCAVHLPMSRLLSSLQLLSGSDDTYV